ncbi:VOC family protein [Modestobacter versicolor]|uniref:Catechol 2,3-dioxygenase-like lactoylglutathione lyase family enzyme n=1 Tax=Modestobacter versicolor TaxID=429133 RepID=A0A323VB44_9ACTN|nr:VOC family protein [Modestobacter versicolor]MBB3676715.1 catechol 2,3-dioxygenase-like lactoylglutathione lyase family enzyme [Modestobacter versicolor]PZA21905.1 VOC family protein [Modestobacter versicolor]
MDDVHVHASPVLPVADLDRALAHYAALGFSTSRHDDTYGFAAWAGLELHLAVVPGHDPLRTASAVFLHVPDADAVAALLVATGVGRTTSPVDTSYGMREGAHVDPDGNLLRFGSPLASGS